MASFYARWQFDLPRKNHPQAYAPRPVPRQA